MWEVGSINLLTLFVTLALSSKAFDKGVEDAKGKSSGLADKIKSGFGTAVKAIGAAIVAATTAVAAGIAKLTQASLASYGEYEQLVGGVKTLFGTEASTLEEYAASIGKTSGEALKEYRNLNLAQSIVFENAKNAYKDVQMSANDYMNTVTSFAASLIQGLSGDTVAAADKANLAITDMADNANKMGTAMESIQNAYQGFAKQNYTMLDNLKLGYGGTKTEMERLLKDAEALQKQNGITAEYSIQNFADIVEAIHVVQTEMGITGTSAKEAGSTIQGSLAMVKSQWQNVLTALADENADLPNQISKLADSIDTAVNGNILPRIQQILPSIASGIQMLVQGLAPMLPGMINTLLPTLSTSLIALVGSLVTVLPQLTNTAVNILKQLVNAVVSVLPGVLSTLASAATELLLDIVSVVGDILPELVDTVINIATDLIQKIADALPDLLPELVQAIMDALIMLIDDAPALLDTAIALIKGLAEGLLNSIPVLLDALPALIESIINFIVGAIPELILLGVQIVGAVVDALPQIISSLVAALPQIIQALIDGLFQGHGAFVLAGIDLFIALIEDLPDIILQLVDAIPQIIGALIDGLRESFPKIVAAGFTLLMGIIERLPDFLMKLGEAVVKIVAAIITALKNRLYLIADQGVKLFEQLIRDLPKAIQTITSKVPQVISGIVNKFREGWNNMKQVGKNLIEGVGEGIMSAANALYERVKSVVSKIKGFFTGKSGFDTHSPSKWSQKVFENVMAGSILGTERGAAGLEMAMQDAVERAKNSFDMGAITYAPAVQSGRVGDINVSVEVTTAGINSEMDAENVGRIIGEKAARQIRYRGGVSFA